ncbi:sialidase family protein [Streptomyces sp. NPDC019990]|uniref:sialidase family protein n=1 Tax=Streptomyces sp. NPDC019990 TaxID=3154693 RepID=UPI0033DDE49E
MTAVAGALAFLTACSGPSANPDTRERVPTRSGAKSPRVPSAPDLRGESFDVRFARDGSGFALLGECGSTGCRQRVAVLDQGADAWRLGQSPLPDTTGSDGITAGLTLLGPGRALLTEGRWPPPDRTWFTSDGGRHWRQGSSMPSGTTAVVPEDGVLVAGCLRADREGNDCEPSALLAVLPATGQIRTLAAQPALEGELIPAGETAKPAEEDAGTLLFVSGRDPHSGRSALAVSQDRGHRWRTSPLPGAAGQGRVTGVVAAGKVLYVARRGHLPEETNVKNGLLSLYRSTDDGRTWERVWRHRKGMEPRSILGVPVAGADGSLTVHSEDGVWRSTDGGHSFTRRQGSGGPSGSVTTTSLGYLWADSFGAGSWRLSADGIRWASFNVGGAA